MAKSRSRRDFRAPNASDSAIGAKLALANARRHQECAKLLAANGQRGVGCSHLVLAIEEAQKGYILALVAAGIPARDLDLQKTLRAHGARHGGAFWDTFGLAQLEIMARHRDATKEKYHLGEARPSEDQRKEWIAGIQQEVEALKDHTSETNSLLAALEWFGSANERKNAGFYVDFSDNGWITPDLLSEETYDRGWRVTSDFLDLRASAIEWILDGDAANRTMLVQNHAEVSAWMAERPERRSMSGLLQLLSRQL